MSYRSRLQSPFQSSQENPNLTPLPPQVDPRGGLGRFQKVNLTTNSAEERTRVPDQVYVRRTVITTPNDITHSVNPQTIKSNGTPELQKTKKETRTTTTIVEE